MEIIITEEQQKIIKWLDCSIYSVEYVQEWINKEVDFTANEALTLIIMGVKGFYDAVILIEKQKMNPLIDIDLTYYFEVLNSGIFGGEGSVGYVSHISNGVRKLGNANVFLEGLIKTVALASSCSSLDIKLISKEEYDLGTEDDLECEEE